MGLICGNFPISVQCALVSWKSDPADKNKLFLLFLFTIFFSFSAQANEWKSKNKFLDGNWHPVEETSAENLKVSGEIPKELAGLFLRIGPNP